MNYPEQLQPDFAANHTASLVVKRFVIDWKTGFNFTYSYATGRPYYNFMYNGGNNKYSIADQGKTKDFQTKSILGIGGKHNECAGCRPGVWLQLFSGWQQ
jgi:hypothetical protein